RPRIRGSRFNSGVILHVFRQGKNTVLLLRFGFSAKKREPKHLFLLQTAFEPKSSRKFSKILDGWLHRRAFRRLELYAKARLKALLKDHERVLILAVRDNHAVS